MYILYQVTNLVLTQFIELKLGDFYSKTTKLLWLLLSRCILFLYKSFRDVGRIMEAVFEETPPPCVLIGHSMGGAIGVHTAYNQYIEGI